MSDITATPSQIAFLRRLDSGMGFDAATNHGEVKTVRVAFQCLLNGWVDRGQITAMGRSLILPTITVLR